MRFKIDSDFSGYALCARAALSPGFFATVENPQSPVKLEISSTAVDIFLRQRLAAFQEQSVLYGRYQLKSDNDGLWLERTGNFPYAQILNWLLVPIAIAIILSIVAGSITLAFCAIILFGVFAGFGGLEHVVANWHFSLFKEAFEQTPPIVRA